MTEYQQAEAELEALVPRLEALVNGEVSMSTYGAAHEAIVGLEPRIIRMKMKALEKDPDKKIYGPKMTARVLEMSDRFETVHEVWIEELEPVLGSAYSAHLERLRQEEAAALILMKTEAAALVARGREQTRLEEEERQRVLVEQKQRLQARNSTRDLLLDKVKDASEARQAARSQAIARVRTMQAGLRDLSPAQQISKALRDLSTKPNFAQVSRGLFNLLSAVVSEPGEQRHRTLRLSNPLFGANIAHTEGYELVLLAAGFDLFLGEDAHGRLEVTLDAADRLSLQQHVPIEELYWIMWEPDAHADFAGWQEWLSRIDEVRRRLGVAAGNFTHAT